MESKRSLYNRDGNILISDQFNNRVIEVTPRGDIIWQFGGGPNNFTASAIIGVNDAQRVGKNTLMAGTGIPAGVVPTAPDGAVDNRVILVNRRGKILWQYGQFGVTGSGFDQLNTPVQNTFVPRNNSRNNRHKHCDDHVLNGTVLITDQGNNRIIEVDERKKIVWRYPGKNTNPNDQLNSPNSAERLENGNTLIADENNNRAIEVNRDDQIVATYTAGGTLGACAFASRLDNGNTLLTDAGNNRIVEVNENDQIVWQYITNAEVNSVPNPTPTRGLRLKNGNTIISDQFNNRVIIVNITNTIVAYYGLPLNGTMGSIGTNIGYSLLTTQLGLYSPYDAKIISDYTGITAPY